MSADPNALAPPSPAPRAASGYGWVWVLIGAAVLGALGWLIWTTRDQVNEARVELAMRLAEADTYNKQTQAIAQQSMRDVKDALAKLSVLENKLSESQNQQVALEALYQELWAGRDDFSLAEIEDTLDIASQQLQLAGNVRGALIALQSVDARLARSDKPRWIQLRRAIANDMEKLKALPIIDTVGMSARLDTLINGVDALPLLAAPPVPESTAPAGDAQEANALTRLGRDMWSSMQDLVRIRDLNRRDVALLPPSQEYFLRENLKLRLLNARLALLARSEENFKADLKGARQLLTDYFDVKARPVAAALATLKQLSESPVSIAPPDIAESLKAVKLARQAREKARK